jgi:hypothetical protein
MDTLPDFIRLLDVPEKYPWLTARYLRQRVADGSIRYYKMGALVFFDPEDLVALMVEA